VTIAVTGGTGFVGSHFLEEAVAAGHRVRALARRPQPQRSGVEWVEGSLGDGDALRRLVTGANAVVHIAGVINAPGAAEFERGSVEGTLAMLAAATAAGVTRFVHVSSLAAREPKLSLYGASKARSEQLVERSGLNWAIVRPPAVYGPGDKETLELFRMAKLRLMLLPPRGRVSLIYVADLARLLLALAQKEEPSGVIYEADDGAEHGWSHKALAAEIGRAVGKSNLALSMPETLLRLGSRVDRLVRGDRAKLSADRAAYFSHRDWAVKPERRPPPELWRPRIEAPAGRAETARWYESEGWL
jgi:nucleoside-diphosphate-sugar epimerase